MKKEELPKEVKEDLLKFHQIQQQMQLLLVQKQNLQMNLMETENAIKEVEKSEREVYEIVGAIMVKKGKDEVLNELKGKRDLLELRIKSIDKQLDKLSEKAVELQKKLSKYLK